MAIKISVIIPTYNRVELLKRALASVPLSKEYQVIVIDDGSKDGTLGIITDWFLENAAKLHEESYFQRFDCNYGVAHAMNRGFDSAEGDYIVSLSDDDYFVKDFSQFEPYLDGKNDLVYFDLQINDGSVFHLDEKSKHEYVGAVKFIRREFLGNTRIPDLKYREDVPFSQELYAKNPKEVFTGIVLKHYNFPHEGSLTWQACNGFKEP